MKKKIPLTILEALQPIANNNLDLVTAVKDENIMFHLVDRDELSDFYFKVTKQESRNGQVNYLVEYKPKSKENISAHGNWLPLDQVVNQINGWLELIQAYNKIHTIYDDPIIKSNQERFEKQFDILDEDADYSGFDLPQQLFLDGYLTNVKAKFISLQENKAGTEKQELEYLVDEVNEIQQNLTKETKRKIIKRLSRLWAKSQKVGLDVIKEIFVNVAAELTKQLISGG